MVHVRPAGTPYPYTQQQYDQQATDIGKVLLLDGNILLVWAKEHSDAHHVTVGVTDGLAMVMRFIPDAITIHKGDTVTFTDRTPIDDPHTISFGQPRGNKFPLVPDGNPTNFTGRPLNSGLVGTNTDWKIPTHGNVYRVTFKVAGSYQFFCAIHGGMNISITVV